MPPSTLRLDTPRQIAFELWCIQEDRLLDRQPLGGVESLLRELRARHPYLADAAIQQGLNLYLERAFLVIRQQVVSLQSALHRSTATRKTGVTRR